MDFHHTRTHRVQNEHLLSTKSNKISFCFTCGKKMAIDRCNQLKLDPVHCTYTQHTLWRSFHSCLPVKEHVGTLPSMKLLLYVLLRNGRHSGVIQVKPMTSDRAFSVSCRFRLRVLWAVIGWSWTDWLCWTGFCCCRTSSFQSYTGSTGDQDKHFRVVLKKLMDDKMVSTNTFLQLHYSSISTIKEKL